MRQVSITQHRHAPTTLWIDGVTTSVDSDEQIGAVLRDAGIHPDQQVNFMSPSGKDGRVKAGTYLAVAPPAKRKGKK